MIIRKKMIFIKRYNKTISNIFLILSTCSILSGCYVSKYVYVPRELTPYITDDSVYTICGEIFGDKKSLSLGFGFNTFVGYSIKEFNVQVILLNNDTLNYKYLQSAYYEEFFLDRFDLYPNFKKLPEMAKTTTLARKQNYFTFSFDDPKKQIRDSVIYLLVNVKMSKGTETKKVVEKIKLRREKWWYWAM